MKNYVLIGAGIILAGIFGLMIGFGVSRRLALVRPNFRINRTPVYQFQSRMGMRTGAFRGLIQGQISKIDNNNITVQLQNGTTYTFIIGSQTVVDKATKGVTGDLKTGQNITVLGGSFLNGAQTILINP